MSALLGAALEGALATLDRLGTARLSVLIFHRVTPQPDPLFPHEMHAQRFDALLCQIARAFTVLTIGQAHAHWQTGTLPRRALAITFDDGYADNAEVALPLLQRHRLAATFFIATGYLDGGRMWNDTVIETLRHCQRDQVDLSSLGLGRFTLGGTAQRRTAIDAVLPVIKYRSLSERERALADLATACGNPTLPADLMMRSAQVRQLHAAGMEIGGHTVRHPILTELDDAAARQEIIDGRDALRALTGAPVNVFAYPNGRPRRDYDRRHVQMVREAGFDCAVSTEVGTVGPRSDVLQWPRFTPWDLDDRAWLARLALARYRNDHGHGV